MPGRMTPLIKNQYYHILNRGISLQPTFVSKRDFERAIETIRFYQNKNIPLRYSKFIILNHQRRQEILDQLFKEKQFLVEIIAYCLMPNHFHFLLRQLQDNGISKFISHFTNSYVRYFNIKNKRNGPLFQGRFKAIRIESDEQLLHLSRYIHLNPYSSYLVKTLSELEVYPYSSLAEYLGKNSDNFCTKGIILNQFKYRERYREFITDQADYQRKFQGIKFLTLESSSL